MSSFGESNEELKEIYGSVGKICTVMPIIVVYNLDFNSTIRY